MVRQVLDERKTREVSGIPSCVGFFALQFRGYHDVLQDLHHYHHFLAFGALPYLYLKGLLN